MTRLHVFPKSALVPFHQLTEPNEAVGGGAAEREDGSTVRGELPSAPPSVADSTQATRSQGRQRQARLCEWQREPSVAHFIESPGC